MDDFEVLAIACISQINPLWLIPSIVIMGLTLVCYCYHCHQCIRDRRRARIEDQKALLPLPLSRLSIIPGYNEVASTKLTHSRNSVDIY